MGGGAGGQGQGREIMGRCKSWALDYIDWNQDGTKQNSCMQIANVMKAMTGSLQLSKVASSYLSETSKVMHILKAEISHKEPQVRLGKWATSSLHNFQPKFWKMP